MYPRIALFSTQRHIDYLKTLSFSDVECELSFIVYKKWKDLPSIYLSVRDDFDGFCTTGFYTNTVLRDLDNKNTKPLQAIMVRSAEYYKEFFKILNSNRNADLSRVILDFSLIENQPPLSIEDYIKSNIVVEKQRFKLYENYSVEQMKQASMLIVQKAKELYENNEMDWLILRHSSLVEDVEKENIPYSFVYPEADNVYDTLNILINEIKLKKMDNALPGVIYVSCDDLNRVSINEVSEVSIDIQRVLLDFSRKNMTGFLIQKCPSGFEIFTSRYMIHKITGGFTSCSLTKALYGALGLRAYVGYGIGKELVRAKTNADKALKLSRIKKCGYLVTEDNNPIELSGASMEADGFGSYENNKQVLYAAKKSGLSISTINRVLSVLDVIGTNEITTYELANALHVTIANANRFMNALEKAGLAKVISKKNAVGKGRPSRVFRISI